MKASSTKSAAVLLNNFMRLTVIAIITLIAVSFASAEDKMITSVTSKDEVVQMPQYIGGESSMTNFILSNVKYPSLAREKNIQGTVYVKMIIAKDGTVHETTLKNSVYPDIDQEALNVVSKMPNWTPGTINGEPVEMSVTIPISFKLK